MIIVLVHLRVLPLVGTYRCGQYAVDLFFVLSGYLITSIILKNSGKDRFLRSFYARRGLRIWPIYYLTLLALVALAPILDPRTRHMEGLPYYLTYTQFIQLYRQLPPVELDLPMFHTWTLAIEEQFYILWPALLCLLGRRGLIPAVATLLAISVAARALGSSTWILLGRSDGLVLGALLAGLLEHPGRVERDLRALRRGFVLSCALGLAALVAGLLIAHALGVPKTGWWVAFNPLAINVFLFGLVGLILCAAGSPPLAVLRDRRLCYLGLISYGLYLYHVPLIWLAELAFRRDVVALSVWVRLALLPVCIAAAALSWELIERPILSLRSRFEYGRRPAPAAPPSPDVVEDPKVSAPEPGASVDRADPWDVPGGARC